jgi:hypothetical protein
MDMSEDTKPRKQHVVLLEPPSKKGADALLVSDDGTVESGRIGGLKEGQPLNGKEMLRLSPHPDSPVVWNVKERVSFEGESQKSKGPAKVTNQAYRNNYDEIFGASDDLPN